MYLELNQMNEINQVQLEIFKEFLNVCERLNLKYYMAHGSLLGAIRYNGFFPFDDDIDVLMPRKDYDKLLKDGQQLFSEKYFVQSCESEKEYPLAFSKIRDSETAFIQPVLSNLNVNQGIYIDIFPLDFYPEKNLTQKILALKEKLYSIRINSRMTFENKQPVYKKLLRGVSVLFCPSWRKTVQKRANLYARIKESSLVLSVGGKKKEKGMPSEWFGKGCVLKFEGLDVVCPSKMEAYMTRIYGDYMNYNPAAKYMDERNRVEVSANQYSTKESYLSLRK